MTDTIDIVTANQEEPAESVVPSEPVDQREVAEQLLAQAKAQGVELVGPDGLLNQLTKRVLETALEEDVGPPGKRLVRPNKRAAQHGMITNWLRCRAGSRASACA